MITRTAEADGTAPALAAVLADHALIGGLSLEVLVAVRREVRRLEADLEAAITLRCASAPESEPSVAGDADRYLTMGEVSARTGLSLSHVYEMARLGRLPAKRMGSGSRGRAYRVLLSELRAWEERQNLVVAPALERSHHRLNANGRGNGSRPGLHRTRQGPPSGRPGESLNGQHPQAQGPEAGMDR